MLPGKDSRLLVYQVNEDSAFSHIDLSLAFDEGRRISFAEIYHEAALEIIKKVQAISLKYSGISFAGISLDSFSSTDLANMMQAIPKYIKHLSLSQTTLCHMMETQLKNLFKCIPRTIIDLDLSKNLLFMNLAALQDCLQYLPLTLQSLNMHDNALILISKDDFEIIGGELQRFKSMQRINLGERHFAPKEVRDHLLNLRRKLRFLPYNDKLTIMTGIKPEDYDQLIWWHATFFFEALRPYQTQVPHQYPAALLLLLLRTPSSAATYDDAMEALWDNMYNILIDSNPREKITAKALMEVLFLQIEDAKQTIPYPRKKCLRLANNYLGSKEDVADPALPDDLLRSAHRARTTVFGAGAGAGAGAADDCFDWQIAVSFLNTALPSVPVANLGLRR
jgi:hypothetical protein